MAIAGKRESQTHREKYAQRETHTHRERVWESRSCGLLAGGCVLWNFRMFHCVMCYLNSYATLSRKPNIKIYLMYPDFCGQTCVILGDASVNRDWPPGHPDLCGLHLKFKPYPLMIMPSCLFSSCWEKLFP